MLPAMREQAKKYRASVFKPDGSIVINHDQTRNVIFHSNQLAALSPTELQMLGFYLMEMSFNRNLNAIIENDHVEYWSHVATTARNAGRLDRWTRTHNPIFSYIDAQLVNQLRPRYKDSINKLAQNALLEGLIHHDFFPSVWSGFAFLEGVCRRLCGRYMAPDGDVRKAFKVGGTQYRSDGGNRRCSRRNKGKPKVSNLAHMLGLTRRVVDGETRAILAMFFRLHRPSEIFAWRNTCLHGSEDRTTVVIVLYCLVSILVIDAIKNS